MAQWRGPRGYVDNVGAAVALAATSEAAVNRVYNVAESDCFSELDWARLVADALWRERTGEPAWPGRLVVLPDDRAPRHLQPPGNTAQHWTTDSTRIRRELGYAEPVARDEALRRTVRWEHQQPNVPGDPGAGDYAAEDAAASALAT
jgi:nucleoside-diphosphate-sugar epimerase